MSAQKASSGTLTVNTVEDVDFPDYYPTVTIVHLGSSGVIWVRTDGEDPVLEGDDTYPVLPGERVPYMNLNLYSDPNLRISAGTRVLMISDTAIPYTVYCY